MDIVVDIAERCNLAEVILASGKTWHGRSAVKDLFAQYNLDFREHVIETLPLSDPGPDFQVDTGRLARAIGRRPTQQLGQIVDRMIASFITETLPADRN